MESFRRLVADEKFSNYQIFNCDENELNFRLLPNRTLATASERSASGRKNSKDRVTINASANASGSLRVPLQVIGKSQRPRCFRGMNMDVLPVIYTGQKNAWMNTDIFHTWFHNSFIPLVRTHLTSIGQEPKAVLVLDNCPAHPDSSELVSDDGKIIAKYLPPGVTSVIQPMNQGVLQALK